MHLRYDFQQSANRSGVMSIWASYAFFESAGGVRNLWRMMRIDNLRERIAKACPHLDKKGLDEAEANIRQYVLLAILGDQRIDLGTDQALRDALTRTGCARDNRQ